MIDENEEDRKKSEDGDSCTSLPMSLRHMLCITNRPVKALSYVEARNALFTKIKDCPIYDASVSDVNVEHIIPQSLFRKVMPYQTDLHCISMAKIL